jgi:NADPH2:quinone reductase
MQAILVERTGGPEAMRIADVPEPAAGPGEARIKIESIGVNFIDVYYRTGAYKAPKMPFTPGMEASGTVEAVGEGVTTVKPGDRVAYSSALGAYADVAAVPADKLVHVPSGVSFEEAAAIMLQGMTAEYLSHTTFPLKEGDVALVHAGAGGVGLLLTQMAKARGATVIATVSTDEKAELSRGAGADYVVMYTHEDFAKEARRLTDGRGVDVVYDAVGAETFDGSLQSLRPRGMLVLYGAASGPVPAFDLQRLNAGGSLFLTRPSLFHYTATREELDQRATACFNMIKTGKLEVRIGARFDLADAADAHRALEARKTTGKVLLAP